MKDFLIVIGSLVLLVASFYAFWVIVLLIVGSFLYIMLPQLKKLIGRASKWK